jgi:RNA polymerase sigma factor (sigma-70 family)
MQTPTTAALGRAIQATRQSALAELSDRELLERFSAENDQAAFTTLFERHAGMVLAVCRRALPGHQDAEDACQATFLVLARKAGRQRWQPSLANWLYATARKVAGNARVLARRRARREGRAAAPGALTAMDQRPGRELLSALDEELEKLPQRYREPLVLCYLEGLPRDEAAARLGVPLNTVKIRLERGRKKLADALTARGWSLGGALLALAATSPAGASPPRLLEAVLAEGVPAPPAVAALAREVVVNRMLKQTGIAVLVLFGVGLLGAWACFRPPPEARSLGEKPTPGKTGKEAPRPAREAEAKESFTYAGRVLGPDGKPLAGANVFVSGLTPGVIEFRKRTVSGADGTFRFVVRRDEFGEKGVVPPSRSPPEKYVHVGATAKGRGAACVSAGQPQEREKLTLWLAAEQIVTGRVIDLEGKALAGVKVSAYIRYARSDKNHKPLDYDAKHEGGGISGNVLPFDEGNAAETDKDGRFTLRGLSRGWLYDLSFRGATVVNSRAQLAARPQKPSTVDAAGVFMPNRPGPQLRLYGSTFTHVATPCKPIRGVVREKGSGRLLAGVEVSKPWSRDDDPEANAVTDKAGRYRLTGLPPGKHKLYVRPAAGAPYLPTEVEVKADQPGIAPVTFDIPLERQPVVTGRVVEGGKPIQAWVEYRPLAKNRNLESHPYLAAPRMSNHPPGTRTDRSGRFSLPVLRGQGVLLVRAEGVYLPARLAKEHRLGGVADKRDPELIDCRPLLAWPGDFHAYQLIHARDGKQTPVQVVLATGRSRELVVEFPDGKARDARVLGLKPGLSEYGETYLAGKSVVAGLAEDEVRRLFVGTADGKLAAACVVRGKEGGPVTVKLKPTGTVKGRVVDKDGKPIAGAGFQIFFDDGPGRPGVFAHQGTLIRALTRAESERIGRTKGYYPAGFRFSLAVRTDRDGRFRLDQVMAEVPFDLKVQLIGLPDKKGRRFITGDTVLARPTVKPGEVRDLGDLRAAAPAKK